MSQNSARLTLAVAFLVCAAGASVPFILKDSVRVKSSSSGKTPSGAAYPAVEVPGLSEASLGWTRPVCPEGDLWGYDLFTPVEVRWKGGAYVPKGELILPQAPFGLRLISLKHPSYRYKFGGYLAMPNAAESIILLRDTVSGATVRAKVGQTVGADRAKVTVLSYDPKAKAVKVKDLAAGAEMTVTDKPMVLADKVLATFATESAPEPVWTATAVGEKFENEGGSYVIKDIDFDAQTVTVEKLSPPDPLTNKRKTAVETLAAAPIEAPAPSPAK